MVAGQGPTREYFRSRRVLTVARSLGRSNPGETRFPASANEAAALAHSWLGNGVNPMALPMPSVLLDGLAHSPI
jgi:hypothetical protein